MMLDNSTKTRETVTVECTVAVTVDVEDWGLAYGMPAEADAVREDLIDAIEGNQPPVVASDIRSSAKWSVKK